MPNCKFCGQAVKTAPVFHPACWQSEVEDAISEFCDNYCQLPHKYGQDELYEKCDNCPVARLLSLGV